ncbi:MAG TPA: hypothetical protein PLR76_07640 [Hyphomonas sp.]|nr:hypothetical protein [Hyphomonas sp.]MCA8904371.1 hypothetical protein [Hyphomonas sp.]MCB9962926.1 hypothetical protein [Hyphomonas sp.]MCB9971311.1 hypothetical protein [Hyphomonas sp.]HPE48252.1 hypothetical protein [Hyphomonas sp.]
MTDPDSRAITTALYRVISQPPGQRDWDSIRDLFHPRATMTRTGAAFDATRSNQCMSFGEYVEAAERNLAGVEFSEVETGHHCEQFGAVAQVRSTYETIFRSGGKESRARGVNFLILVRLETRWQIIAIAWDNEREGLALPADWLVMD